MFGKKSSSSNTKSKPKKKTVKQGPKVNFFAAHAEKMVLALVVGLLGYLVYDGFGGKTYDQTRKPPQLAEKAKTISNNIKNGDPWPAIQEQIKDTVAVPDKGYTPKTEAARQPTDEKIYGALALGGAAQQQMIKRGDPTLSAPIKIVGQSVMGLIAVEANDDYVDPFEDFLDAVKLKGKNNASNQPRTRQRGSAEGSSGASEGSGTPGGLGETGMGYGPAGGAGKRFFPSKYNRGFSMNGGTGMGGGLGSGMGSGMGGETGMMGDMGSAMGGSMGMGGGTMGMGGAAGGATGGGLNGAQRVRPKKYKAELMLFNAVTALVPHEEMVKEFDAKLRESAYFNAMRDKPIYLGFVYQRSEVVPGQPDKWEDAGNDRQQLNMMKKWVSTKMPIPEVIDMTSFERALTMPIPPLLLQDYRKFAKHPDIDWIWDAGMNQTQVRVPVSENQADSSDQLLVGERPMNGMGGMGGGMGSMGSGAGMGSEMGMGSMMMGGGMDGGMGSGMGSMGSMGGSMGGEMGMGSMMGGGMGGEMGYGSGMGSGGYGMGGMNFLPAKYKMIRFYDKLDPAKHIGKTFRYRIKLIMDDPNYPGDRFPAPPNTDMETPVFQRVKKLRDKEDPIVEQYRQDNQKAFQVSQANKTPFKPKYFTRQKLETEWSAPSKGVYVRGYDDVYVHKMGKKASANPEIEAVVVRLDSRRGAYVPQYIFVEDEEAVKKQLEELDRDVKSIRSSAKVPPFKRGSIMAMGPFTTEVAHPILNVLKRWVNYDTFDKGWNTVIDIRGGDTLAGSKQEDPLTDNVEMMMMMSDGRIAVSNEFDDTTNYRGFTLADEREAAEKGTNAQGMGSGGGLGGGMDGGSGGGMSGSR